METKAGKRNLVTAQIRARYPGAAIQVESASNNTVFVADNGRWKVVAKQIVTCPFFQGHS